MAKKVFISYAHESEELSNNILDFSNHLRSNGIDSEIDQYEESPEEGWPKWMMRQIQEADFVLVCCSKLFYERSNDFSGNKSGLGIKWETNLILQLLYNLNSKNTKFIPFFFGEGNQEFIPLPLQPYTYYQATKPSDKEKLINRILGINQSKRPILGEEPRKTNEKHSLDPKVRKSMFFSSIIDVDLWNNAKWNGMTFLVDFSLNNKPIVCFIFDNNEIGNQIFKELKKQIGTIDSDKEIRLSFIENISIKNPKYYKVTFGTSRDAIINKLKKYGLKPNSTLLMMLSRIHEMHPTKSPSSFDLFKQSYSYFKEYFLTNATVINNKIRPNYDNMIQMKDVFFRTKSDVIKDINDEDIVAFPSIAEEFLKKQ